MILNMLLFELQVYTCCHFHHTVIHNLLYKHAINNNGTNIFIINNLSWGGMMDTQMNGAESKMLEKLNWQRMANINLVADDLRQPINQWGLWCTNDHLILHTWRPKSMKLKFSHSIVKISKEQIDSSNSYFGGRF